MTARPGNCGVTPPYFCFVLRRSRHYGARSVQKLERCTSQRRAARWMTRGDELHYTINHHVRPFSCSTTAAHGWVNRHQLRIIAARSARMHCRASYQPHRSIVTVASRGKARRAATTDGVAATPRAATPAVQPGTLYARIETLIRDGGQIISAPLPPSAGRRSRTMARRLSSCSNTDRASRCPIFSIAWMLRSLPQRPQTGNSRMAMAPRPVPQ